MVWHGLSDYVISSGRGDGDKNGGCPILTPKVERNIGVPAAPGRSTSGAAAGRGWAGLPATSLTKPSQHQPDPILPIGIALEVLLPQNSGSRFIVTGSPPLVAE